VVAQPVGLGGVHGSAAAASVVERGGGEEGVSEGSAEGSDRGSWAMSNLRSDPDRVIGPQRSHHLRGVGGNAIPSSGGMRLQWVSTIASVADSKASWRGVVSAGPARGCGADFCALARAAERGSPILTPHQHHTPSPPPPPPPPPGRSCRCALPSAPTDATAGESCTVGVLGDEWGAWGVDAPR